jgi:hypothetical protein
MKAGLVDIQRNNRVSLMKAGLVELLHAIQRNNRVETTPSKPDEGRPGRAAARDPAQQPRRDDLSQMKAGLVELLHAIQCNNRVETT